jgi:DNA-binding MarR family transcriptional regulator
MQSAEPSVRACPSSDDVHGAIRMVTRLTELFVERRKQLAESAGLTEQQWGVLEEIATEHFMPSLFARQRESSAAAVSKILRQLTDKGLITVSVSKADGRQRDYLLTAKGKRVMDRLRAGRQDAIAAVWLALDGRRLRDFTEFGSEIIERLSAYAEGATSRG